MAVTEGLCPATSLLSLSTLHLAISREHDAMHAYAQAAKVAAKKQPKSKAELRAEAAAAKLPKPGNPLVRMLFGKPAELEGPSGYSSPSQHPGYLDKLFLETSLLAFPALMHQSAMQNVPCKGRHLHIRLRISMSCMLM